jgi:hypothetical protein
MPKVIPRTKDIAFMIAVSCPAVDSVDQSAYLVEKQILCEGYDEAEAKKARRYYRQRAYAKNYKGYLKAAEYLDKNPVVGSMNWGGILSKDQFSPRSPSSQGFFNPITLIEKTTIPMLAIFGEKDTQIDPFQGAAAYEKALKRLKIHFIRSGSSRKLITALSSQKPGVGRNRWNDIVRKKSGLCTRIHRTDAKLAKKPQDFIPQK